MSDGPGLDPVDLEEMPEGGRRLALLVGIPVAVVVALLVLLLANGDASMDRVGTTPLAGKPAPAIEGVDLDGRPFDLDGLRGQWVVVNFFASDCVPCIQEHPELVAFSADHRRSGDASVVSVAFDDKPSNVREFFERNGGDWPVLAEDTGAIAVRYGVLKVPESYLVSPNGLVAVKLIGGVTAAQLDRLVDELSGRPVVDGGAADGGAAG
jgi:cytochrome c biogenesis protein CcmG, thiol:disulfide interchange protein DsbE